MFSNHNYVVTLLNILFLHRSFDEPLSNLDYVV